MEPPKVKLEWIVWKDACGDSSRAHVDSIKQAQLVTNCNVGWVIDEDADRIVLCHGNSTSGELDHFVIPTNCVVLREVIGRRKQKGATDAKEKTKPAR